MAWVCFRWATWASISRRVVWSWAIDVRADLNVAVAVGYRPCASAVYQFSDFVDFVVIK
jgi:hypothetical protein